MIAVFSVFKVMRPDGAKTGLKHDTLFWSPDREVFLSIRKRVT